MDGQTLLCRIAGLPFGNGLSKALNGKTKTNQTNTTLIYPAQSAWPTSDPMHPDKECRIGTWCGWSPHPNGRSRGSTRLPAPALAARAASLIQERSLEIKSRCVGGLAN